MNIGTLDYHAAGEPLRVVTSGLPEIPGGTMLEKRRFAERELDDLRRFLMFEPRGHADMYGAILTSAVTDDGDFGVLFMHNAGFSTMCGHGIIALVTAGLERNLFQPRDPGKIRIDTPAGRVTARPNPGRGRPAESVSFVNVPSFVLPAEAAVQLEGREIRATIAWGGAFYAYVDADDLGFALRADEAPELIRRGRQLRQAISKQHPVRHPAGGDEFDFYYGVIFVRRGESPRRSRNACVFADGELDRSPTGTGVSGRAAIHYFAGDIGLNEDLIIESVIGSTFSVRCLSETQVGGLPAVVPEVTGSAHACSESVWTLDPADGLGRGFLLR